MMPDPTILETIQQDWPLVVFAALGGGVLVGVKLVEHFWLAPEQKMSVVRYCIFAIFIILFLPFLGGIVATVYIANGDQISPILAFQVGLTSPAIVQSLMAAAGNKLAGNPVDVPDSEQ